MKKLINAGMALFAAGLVSGCGTTAQTAVAQAAKPVEVAPATSEQAGASYDKPGFSTAVANGRLWVFRADSPEWDAFKASGKGPAVHTVRPMAGPERMTVLSPDSDTLVEYLVAKPGFHVKVVNERLWVFAEGSKELEAFTASGKTPAVHTVRPRAGPMGMTIIAPDGVVLDAYMGE